MNKRVKFYHKPIKLCHKSRILRSRQAISGDFFRSAAERLTPSLEPASAQRLHRLRRGTMDFGEEDYAVKADGGQAGTPTSVATSGRANSCGVGGIYG